MKQFIQLALLKAFVISVGSTLIYVLYGLVSDNPYKVSLAFEMIFFLVLFIINIFEYLWESRKKKHTPPNG